MLAKMQVEEEGVHKYSEGGSVGDVAAHHPCHHYHLHFINDIIIAMMIKEVGIGEYRWIARPDIPEDERMLNHNCHEISDWAWQVL